MLTDSQAVQSGIFFIHFPPVLPEMIDDGYTEFAERWKPILDAYKKLGIRFALEVHPTEIAFDIASARRALRSFE